MTNNTLIVGFHAINARLWQAPESLREIYLLASKNDWRSQALLNQAKATRVKVYRVHKERLDALSVGTRHQGVVAFINAVNPQVSLEDFLRDLSTPPLLLILDEVKDPHNLGAAMRIANAMGVDAMIVPKNKSAGLGPTVSKVACGAAETLPYFTVTNLSRTIELLKEHHIWIYGTHLAGGISLYETELPSAIAWVMGSEDKGLRRLTKEHCDALVYIPMYGTVESMNVAVSTGIVLAETRRQIHQCS